MMLVISNFDLTKFGCPNCGSIENEIFITNGTCSIWNCNDCFNDFIVVGNSIIELRQFIITNTQIRDMIGNHPYQYAVGCQINAFSTKLNYLSLC